MQISIQTAKNGEETASIDNCFLHSSYAPSKEAERFVQSLEIPFKPESIVITEPALSYVVPFLRQAFPEVRLGVIRYTKFFEKYNSGFDFVLNYFEHPDFENYLERTFNEEEILSMHFISWQPSGRIFPEENQIVWNAIKAAFERSKTLLVTRQYFEKKWLTNSAVFFQNIRHPLILKNQIDKDCVIISSGPSLKESLPLIKENRNKLFVICLSSAISVCIKNGITPDLCMTTDGGFWAGEHLKKLHKNNIPLAMPAEALCNKDILRSNQILPLIYDDGVSREMSLASGITFSHAVRNGTVSGTALLFACQYCTKNIYMCGLDLAGQKGYQHLQPNELEINNAIKDNRVSTKEKRLTGSEFSSASLEIYKNWFITNKLNLGPRKVYRVIEEAKRKNNLGWISDINANEFSDKLNKIAEPKQTASYFVEQACENPAAKVAEYFEKNADSEKWKKQIFPLDYVSLSHNPDNKELSERIEKNYNNLKEKIRKILNER